MYQNEEYIGEVIQNLNELSLKREDVFITTKDQGRGQCRTKILEAIKRLKTPYLDLVLIHWPGVKGINPRDPKVPELRKGSYEDLEDLQSEGLIRSIGVSNYMISHLDELLKHCKVVPVVNQVSIDMPIIL
jgi:diketogulonate reductase-like aldo/keto reductase